MTEAIEKIDEKKARRLGKMSALVQRQFDRLFAEDLHAARVLSLKDATMGVLASGMLGVHAIGLGLAAVRGLNQKHATKQVDRLLSNRGIDVSELAKNWVPFVLGQRSEALVALDWSDFDADDQTMLCLHLVSSHGRATPLLWKTVAKSKLKGRRAGVENQLIADFLEIVGPTTKVTILADRGFADQKLFTLLGQWQADYVIRMRGCITVQDASGQERRADEWVPGNGRATKLEDARITHDRASVPAVVCVRAAKMKEPWCLVTSRKDLPGPAIVKLYGRRFTIEESFRDIKDPRFGFGLSNARVNSPARRDRLLLIATLAVALLTLLGAAGDSLGYERMLKANTRKARSYSFVRQGLIYYGQIPMMPEERLLPLITKFTQLLAEVAVFRQIFGIL